MWVRIAQDAVESRPSLPSSSQLSGVFELVQADECMVRHLGVSSISEIWKRRHTIFKTALLRLHKFPRQQNKKYIIGSTDKAIHARQQKYHLDSYE